jgi:hypothetical protein
MGGRLWSLEWAVKGSFVGYVCSMPDGSIDAIEGTGCRPQGNSWSFAPSPSEPAGAGGLLRFSGELRFRAHDGMLLVILMDPWLTVTDEEVELSVVDLTAWPDRSRREVLARGPALKAGALSASSVSLPLVLAETAVDIFNVVYPPGTALAPAILNAVGPAPRR